MLNSESATTRKPRSVSHSRAAPPNDATQSLSCGRPSDCTHPQRPRSGLTELYRPNGCSSVLHGYSTGTLAVQQRQRSGHGIALGGRTLSHSFCSTASSFRSPAEMPLTSLLPLESASQSAQNGTMFHSTTCVPNTAPTAVASRFHVLEMRIPPRVCDLRRAWGHVHERISIPEWHTFCALAATGHAQ